MHHFLSTLVTVALAIALLAWPESAQATTYVSIGTISTKTVPYGGTVQITPKVTTRSKVKVVSTRLTVKQGSAEIARNARAVALPAGTYRLTVTVSYRVRSGSTYGHTRTASKSQNLSILSAPAPAETRVIAPPSSPCGTTATRKTDGSAWTCAFSDEFSGSSLDSSKWRVQLTELDGVHTGPECWVDSPDNIAVADGTLRLTTREEAEPFTCKSPYGDYTSKYTGASVNTWGHFSQTYGRFEFRAKFPDVKVAGTHGALWLYPESTQEYGSQDSASGEIDIAEVYSVYPDRAVPYIHYQSRAGDATVTAEACMINPATFHTYTAEWTPKSVKISYDGKLCQEHVWNPLAPLLGSAPFDRPFVAVMTQTLGATGTANEFVPGSTPLPATMQVDYVRIWS
jgi:beta-glucanase (GH16 family)